MGASLRNRMPHTPCMCSVMEYFIKLIKKKFGKDVSKDVRAISKLRREAERAKRALSSQHQVRMWMCACVWLPSRAVALVQTCAPLFLHLLGVCACIFSAPWLKNIDAVNNNLHAKYGKKNGRMLDAIAWARLRWTYDSHA